MTKDELAVQMSRLKDAGKHITMDSIKELCKSTNTPWTAELEKHLEQYCVPPRPIKTHRQIFTEGLHSLAIDVTGEAIDEGMEKARKVDGSGRLALVIDRFCYLLGSSSWDWLKICTVTMFAELALPLKLGTSKTRRCW
jgi:hypothetical protein